MYLALLCGTLILVILIILIWVAYSFSAAYQQTITITLPFDETYRYVPHLNKYLKYKIDSLKVTVTGSIKKDSLSYGTITPSSHIKDIIHKNIIDPYKNCLLVQEANTFLVDEKILKRCPIIKSPTVENLSIIFFNKLLPIMPNIGTQLVSVTISSGDIKATQSRYKVSNYTTPKN